MLIAISNVSAVLAPAGAPVRECWKSNQVSPFGSCHISSIAFVMELANENYPIKKGEMMQSRMNHPAMIIPGAMEALQAVSKLAETCGLPKELRELVHLRASQINGCSVCVDMHWRGLKRSGETDERAFAVAAWRDAPYFTDAERAALALTEAVTRLSDREDPVPDAVWDEAARHFDDKALSALLLNITVINMWNRLNVATKQVAGAWMKSPEAREIVERALAAR